MTKTIKIIDLAYYIINSKKIKNLNHLKLQKLLYYIQSWHLVFRNKNKLFNNNFEAWVHGPVIRDVYNHFKVESVLYKNLSEDSSRTITLSDYLEEEQIEIITDVLNEYGDKSPYYLECLTHEEKPWIEARGNCEENQICSTEINNDTINTYYTSLIS